MHHRHRGTVACQLATTIVAIACSAACADLVGSYTVGTGNESSFVQFEFANANAYLYEVRHDGGLFGNDLFAIIAAAQPGFFSFEVVTFSFGDALFGVTIGADTNAGFGTPPDYLDYWHYWTREPGGADWTESFIGFGDRAVSDGSWDAWLFNSANAPSTVPAPSAMVLLAWAARRRRSR